jgi:hypothetical protein
MPQTASFISEELYFGIGYYFLEALYGCQETEKGKYTFINRFPCTVGLPLPDTTGLPGLPGL